MTAMLTQTTSQPASPMSRDEVKRMLQDAAYVLHLTRRVKDEIIAERPEAKQRSSRARRRPELAAAGLGV